MINNLNLLSFIIIFLLFILSICRNIKENIELNNLIDNYYLSEENDFEEIEADKFVENYIENNSTKFYKFLIPNDSEEIYFDFQSDYGCLNLDIKEDISNYSFSNIFQFCSQGTNNIFNLSKNEILEKSKKTKIENLNIIIMIEFSSLLNENTTIYYSLKVSLKKPDINIFEINSYHKILCKTEKINEKNICIFMITNKSYEELEKNIIIYPNSLDNNIKLNIYADFINKNEYEEWNATYLLKNIPNENSRYNNNGTDFIIISNLDEDEKYIYLSIESNIETTIEMVVNFIKYDINQSPLINEFQIYSINNISNHIEMNINQIKEKEISVSFGVLYGKGSIHLMNDESKTYIIDTIDDKITFNFNMELSNNEDSYEFIINNLENNYLKDIGFIFYVFIQKRINILNEISYGKSSKIINNNYSQLPLILYEKISNEEDSLNINLQFYNFSIIDSFINNNLDIEIMILSKKEFYEIKLDYEKINNYEKIKRKFDNVLSTTNIYLSQQDMKHFNITENSWLIIYIPINNTIIKVENPLILGTTIFDLNNLNYLSERIYHYGKINNGEKVVYKLKGNINYHLMRLEFGCNSEYIGWSVKRTNENENYKNNDTDLSFVTEKWINGRELLTMFIENGEDIYLTVFIKENLENRNLTSHAFKYINSGKNGDFKNYLIKYDSLDYDKEENIITINKLKNIPETAEIYYYLKIIKKEDYIKNESINTIAITQSNSNTGIKCNSYKNNIICNLKNYLKEINTYYINTYSFIYEDNTNIEYLSYSSLIINKNDKSKESHKKIIIISISLGGSSFLFLIIGLCCYLRNKRIERYVNQISFIDYLDYGSRRDSVEDRYLIEDDILL